jgi:hypothetical protein
MPKILRSRFIVENFHFELMIYRRLLLENDSRTVSIFSDKSKSKNINVWEKLVSPFTLKRKL